MSKWNVTLSVGATEARLLVSEHQGDLLKARLPVSPEGPRALLTLLEGLSLWSGQTLSVAVPVGAHAARGPFEGIFDGQVWPPESALVHFWFLERVRRARRIRGLGEFRSLYASEVRS